MRYVSTLNQLYSVDAETAFLASQPPKDVGGLYVPDAIPKFTPDELEQIRSMEFHEIATLVNKKFIGDAVPEFRSKLTMIKNNY